MAEDLLPATLPPPDLVIDALLGTGVQLPLSSSMTKIVATINGLNAPVLAVDLPPVSMPTPAAPWAHWCVPPAPSLSSASSRACSPPTGWTESATSTGIPWGDAGEERVPAAERIDYPSLKGLLTPRRRSAPQGTQRQGTADGGGTSACRGHLLAGQACLRAGAGLVRLRQHPDCPAASLVQPELMGCPADMDEGWASVQVLGPGLGQDGWGRARFEQGIGAAVPLVLDADGLNWLAQAPVIRIMGAHAPPREAARLLGCTIAEVEGTGLRPSRGCNSATVAWCCSRGGVAHLRRQAHFPCATRATPAWPVAAWVTSCLV